jgi:hypothetical protein
MAKFNVFFPSKEFKKNKKAYTRYLFSTRHRNQRASILSVNLGM